MESENRSAPLPSPSSETTDWGRAALKGLFEELRGVAPGQRDNTRNRVAYRCGRIVAGGHVTHDDAVSMIFSACVANGLVEEGEEKIKRRILAGIEAGMRAGPKGPVSRPPVRTVITLDGVSAEPFFHYTDVGNGKRLIHLFGENLRWSKALGWLVYDDERWIPDDLGGVVSYAKRSIDSLRCDDASEELEKHISRSENAQRVKSAIEMAQSEPGVAITPERLDANPMLLGCVNGVLDLTTGKLREHRRDDLITRVTYCLYDEQAKCPRWEQFLDETFQGDRELIDFIQLAFGYSLSGATKEQILFLCHGVGSNGKSTMLSTLRRLVGEYGSHADFSTFLEATRTGGGPRGDLARLAGVRVVTSTEPDSNGRFSESTIKAITGGDPVTCAYKFRDEFTYTPQFKLWLAANHKPRIRGTDHAIWRRIRLIPFSRVFLESEMDKNLEVVLASELSGILSWAVDGCLAWQSSGLTKPAAVVAATEAYREEEDYLAEFLGDKCAVNPGASCYAGDLYCAYKTWAEAEGSEPVSKKLLAKMLSERGFTPFRESGPGTRCWRGVSVRT